MAERYAVATGNWSAVGTWNGGVSIPTAGDAVHANGFTVTIDQNITVGSIRTDAGSTAAAGGGFECSGAYTINADCNAGTTVCLTTNNTSGTTVAVVGDCYGGTSTNADGLRHGSTGTTEITGNAYGGNGNTALGIRNNAGGTLTLNGDSYGGTGANCAGARNASTGLLTVTGTAYCGTNFSAPGLYASSTSRAYVGAAVWDGTNGGSPLWGRVVFLDGSAATIKIRDTSLVEHTLSAGGGGGTSINMRGGFIN